MFTLGRIVSWFIEKNINKDEFIYIYKSHRCIINDNVKILDDSLITPDTIIPPFSVYGGKPGFSLFIYGRGMFY